MASDASINLMFGMARAAKTPLPEDHILIVPTDDNWNDFGFRTRVTISANVNGATWQEVAFIGFLTNTDEEPADIAAITQRFDSNSELTIAVRESARFFTMLPSMQAYRDVVYALGAAGAVRVLRALRDLVVLKEFRSKANWLDLATRSQVFLKSFMRTSESFFAYYNAGTILRGLDKEVSRRLSKSLGISFRLPGLESDHNLVFRFDQNDALPKRIAVVIGKNGVGKSQTLGRIVSAALKGSSALIDVDTSDRPLINRVMAFAPTNEAKSVFPTDRQRRPQIWYKRFSLNRDRSSLGDGVAGTIVQVARSRESIRDTTRWEIFLQAITAIQRWEEIELPTTAGHFIPLRTLDSRGERDSLQSFGFVDQRKEPVRVIDGVGYPLSSGEISFLRFAAQASLHIENGSLLLLDEPETHLHPNFISQLVLLLDNLLFATGSAAIVATHSAYFVREVFPSQVTVLGIDQEGFVAAERPRLQTFGADVGAISYFVFGEDEPSRLASRVEAQLLERFTRWEDLYNAYKSELSTEVLGALREAMEARTLP
jgi:energy-coupling factor transporter ATP-binding protein EcfA2